MTLRKRIGILISGRGSNMNAIIEACKSPDYPAEVVLVISNRPEAKGLDTAKQAGIETKIVDHKQYSSRDDFDAVLHEAFLEAKVDYICSAGFMRILTEKFVEEWKNRQLNIHPSLLPSFKGLNVHRRVIESGVKITGCTVHFVRAEMDSGPIIAQAAVPVLPKDDADTLAERVLAAEHQLYPHALKLVVEEKVRVVNELIIPNNSYISDGNGILFSPGLN